ncbi:MAG TPA: protein-tyrosine phosphatase family protein [Rhizomicrobium sp.]|nr:protein-tyrosine phosphatase family protein [Rhizomicrobium sp.]
MPKIIIAPLSGLEQTIRDHEPSHVITLLSPEHMIETPDGFHPDRHLKIGMNDVAHPSLGEAPPHDSHIQSLLEFGRLWDASAPLVVHCWAGISRSTAAAFILMCDRLDHVRESEIAKALRQRAPHANPNRLMVKLADEALKRGGRMVEAVESMGPSTLADEGPLVHFPLAFGIL